MLRLLAKNGSYGEFVGNLLADWSKLLRTSADSLQYTLRPGNVPFLLRPMVYTQGVFESEHGIAAAWQKPHKATSAEGTKRDTACYPANL